MSHYWHSVSVRHQRRAGRHWRRQRATVAHHSTPPPCPLYWPPFHSMPTIPPPFHTTALYWSTIHTTTMPTIHYPQWTTINSIIPHCGPTFQTSRPTILATISHDALYPTTIPQHHAYFPTTLPTVFAISPAYPLSPNSLSDRHATHRSHNEAMIQETAELPLCFHNIYIAGKIIFADEVNWHHLSRKKPASYCSKQKYIKALFVIQVCQIMLVCMVLQQCDTKDSTMPRKGREPCSFPPHLYFVHVIFGFNQKLCMTRSQ